METARIFGGQGMTAAATKDRTGENFPVGSILIHRRLRPHVHAFYAFARLADDIADSPALGPDDKTAQLDTMEAVLLGRASGVPAAEALRQSLAMTGVTSRHAQDLLMAFRQDATKRRYADWEELLDYCRLSAMPVGRHVLDLHGEEPSTYAASDPLCASLQVLNHLQDGSKDLAALDRCYLPQDLLDVTGARVGDLAGRAATPALRLVWDRLLDRVDAMNRAGAHLPLRTRDRRLRLETGIIHGLAVRLTRRLRQKDPVATRVKLQKSDVAGAVLAAFRYLR